MRISAMTAGLAMLFATGTAQAQQAPPPATPVIRVIGHGEVKTPPDIATIEFFLRGEGRTSDDAVRALVVRQHAAEAVLAGRAQVRTGKLSIAEARDKACDADEDGDSMSGKPRLSTGSCAIIGYAARLTVTAKVTPINDAGTLLGSVGSVGGVNPRIESFELRDPAPAQRAATANAMADARRQAEAIASASGSRLGHLRRVEDQRAALDTFQDVVVTAERLAGLPQVMAPVVVTLSPEPIETEANLVVEFEIGPTP